MALDGDGASTFLITVSALLPVYKRLGMSPLVLTGVVCLGAGVMNMIPWGGPTVRAMAALKLDSSEVFIPVLPAMGCRRRLGAAGLVPDRPPGAQPSRLPGAAVGTDGRTSGTATDARRRRAARSPGERPPASTRRGRARPPPRDGPGTVRVPPLPRTWLTVFNLLLTMVLVVGLVLEVMPLPVLFVLGFAVALLVNHPTWEEQQALLDKHGKSVVLVTTMIFAAGVLTGILTGTKMIDEMAEALVSVVPDSLGGHLPGARGRHRHAAEPGLHPGRLLLRRAARARRDRARLRHRPGRDRPGRHPRPDDHGLPAQPAHRRPRSSWSA